MKRTNLDAWIEQIEGIPHLTRESLESLQLRRLNEMLARVKERGGFYKDCPEKLGSLSDLRKLPFTTAKDLSECPGKFLLTSQSEVSRVISGATSGTTGPAKRVFYTDTDTAYTVGLFTAGISEMLTAGEKCFIAFPFTGPFGLGDLIAKAVERLGGIPVKAGFGQTFGEMLSLLEETRPETYIGFPVTLLSLIRETQSVRDACSRMQISYSTAWNLLNSAEDSLGYPLILRNKGGPSGSGSFLTEKGNNLLTACEQFESAAREKLEQLYDTYFENVL